MTKLIYDSRIFQPLFTGLGKFYLWCARWQIVGEVPKHKKFVAIAAPHTSNWDFPTFMAVVGALRLRVRFVGKHTLFEGVLGKLFYWLGGMPVNRDASEAGDIIGAVVEMFESHDELILGIAPEGTRSSTTRWKTGFYRIAQQANVPIELLFLDASTRKLGFLGSFYVSGDQEKDIAEIQEKYSKFQGLKK